jgi:hypothetical protein
MGESGQLMDFKLWLESLRDHVYLFRGIGGPPNPLSRLGKWWSTNPYYGMRYGGLVPGQIFVAVMPRSAIEEGLANGSIVDATQDEYPNYIFRQDPARARAMTPEEIQQFRDLAGPSVPSPTSFPGGEVFRQLHGQAAVDAAYKVYG